MKNVKIRKRYQEMKLFFQIYKLYRQIMKKFGKMFKRQINMNNK